MARDGRDARGCVHRRVTGRASRQAEARDLEKILTRAPFTAPTGNGRELTREVYRAPQTGPPVIVIHEAMGLTESTLGVAARVRDRNLTPILPLLVGSLRPGALAGAVNFLRVCVVAEFGAWASNRSSPVANWLQALAAEEAKNVPEHRVGVIGMCFSGGYALAMTREPTVAGTVSSQPSFPMPVPGLRRQLGMPPSDYQTVRANTSNGRNIRALRYELDNMSPPHRQARIAAQFPEAELVVLPSCRRRDHSVLSDGVDTPREDVAAALTRSLDFLVERLRPGPAGG